MNSYSLYFPNDKQIDFASRLQNAVQITIGKELEMDIDPKDIQTIHLQEVVQCLRRSYYDRIDPEEIERRGFNELLSGLLRKLEYGNEPKNFEKFSKPTVNEISGASLITCSSGLNPKLFCDV